MLGCQDNCCKCSGYFDCQDYQCIGHNTSTVYSITPVGMYDDLSVFCDFEEDGQGWIVSYLSIHVSVVTHIFFSNRVCRNHYRVTYET